ncbi:RodZ domain-containing protein [Nocardioides aurantiacus]|uniref:RodZ domain-containing protein n=1 Tax=Nocardioides aurantiacus TaxID=86796 RepID=UPI00403F38BB
MNAPTTTVEPTGVSVRQDARTAAVVALLAAVLTVAWFARALGTADPLDWLWCLVPAAVGLLQLLVVRDARSPMLVADELGVRVRRGHTWHGVQWPDVDRVEVRSGGRWLADGRLVVHPRVRSEDPFAPADDADAQAAVPELRELSVPLGPTTRIDYDGLTGDLVADLDSLGQGRVPVLVLTRPVREPRPAAVEEPVQEPVEEPAAEVVAESEPEPVAVVEPEPEPEPVAVVEPEPEVDEGVAAYEPVDPTRVPRRAARAEVVRESVRRLPDPPTVPAQRAPGGPVLVARIDDTGDAPATVPVEMADTAPHPVAEPVIGPLVAAARHRARLSIDTLSERTRIRPHVLECIEVDDFEACGGDFYARGHLRTLARVFGLDPAELVGLYDRHYATAEIEARQVFEAELATGIGGGVRTASSGPRWSLLAASVLALVAIWGVARVFNDTPQELVSPAPDVVDVAGLASGEEPTAAPQSTLAALSLTARGASPQVVVRDRDGKILLAARLVDGAQQQVIGLAPFDVTSSNGSAVSVTYLGKKRGTVGDSEQPDNRQVG